MSQTQHHLRLRHGEREIEVSGDLDWVRAFWEDPVVRGIFLEPEESIESPALRLVPEFPDSDEVEILAPRGAGRRRAPGAGSAGRKRRVQKLITPPADQDRFTRAIRASGEHKARIFLALRLARELYKLDGLSMAEILQVLNGRCGLSLHRSSLDASLKRVDGGFEKVRPRWSNQVRLYRLTPEGEGEADLFLRIAETPVPTAADALAAPGSTVFPAPAD